MNLLETLKNFKTITPDPAFAEKSKRAILATEPRERWSVKRAVAHFLEAGIAVALAVLFVFVIAGQFANAPLVSPAEFSVINPQTLRAEAQAVDIQIQLANVAYQEPTTTIGETTPQAIAGTSAPSGFASAALHASATTSTSVSTGAEGSSTATSTPGVSVDEALKALSE